MIKTSAYSSTKAWFTDKLLTTDDNSKSLKSLYQMMGVLCALSVLFSTAIYIYNYFFTQYAAVSYNYPNIWAVLLQGLLIIIGCYSLFPNSCKIRNIATGYGIYLLAAFCNIILSLAVSRNIHSWTIDTHLLHFDTWLGYNTLAVLAWVKQHHMIHSILHFCYGFVTLETLFLACPLMCIFCKPSDMARAINLSILTTIIGMLIYYFLPSSIPAHVLNSHLFSQDQQHTFIPFFQIHHKIPTTVIAADGNIDMPSFHTLWALTFIYLFRKNIWILAPITVINSIAIAATFMLGNHFLADSLASIVIFFVCLYLLNFINKIHDKRTGKTQITV